MLVEKVLEKNAQILSRGYLLAHEQFKDALEMLRGNTIEDIELGQLLLNRGDRCFEFFTEVRYAAWKH
jgi:hypothetical protein